VPNQDNPALEGVFTLAISSFGDHGYFDFQTINATANRVREYSFVTDEIYAEFGKAQLCLD